LAALPEQGFFIPAGGQAQPEPGDVVVFDRLLEDSDFDHLGVVIGLQSETLETAEGNVRNTTGIFFRDIGPNISGYVRIRGY
jgi:hypothetical protein